MPRLVPQSCDSAVPHTTTPGLYFSEVPGVGGCMAGGCAQVMASARMGGPLGSKHNAATLTEAREDMLQATHNPAFYAAMLQVITDGRAAARGFLLLGRLNVAWLLETLPPSSQTGAPVSLISTTQPFVSFSKSLRNEASNSRRPGLSGSAARMSSMRMGRPESVEQTRRCRKC